jgi:hypothetical protein
MNQPDTRPTSQKIAHRSFAVIGVIVLALIAVPILCVAAAFFGGVAVKVDEAMDNAAREVNASNANSRPSTRTR